MSSSNDRLVRNIQQSKAQSVNYDSKHPVLGSMYENEFRMTRINGTVRMYYRIKNELHYIEFSRVGRTLLDEFTDFVFRKVQRTEISDSDYTVKSTDHIIVYTSLSASRTVTIPNSLLPKAKMFCIKDETGNANLYSIVLNPESATTINGQATVNLDAGYGSFWVYPDGTNWFTI